MEPFIGTILAFGFNFAPHAWAYCNGALINLQQNTALFSLLGTHYGGDGKTNFGLPNLQGSVAIGFSTSHSPMGVVEIGQKGGTASHTMTLNQMPSHTHTASGTISVPVFADTANQETPDGHYLAVSSGLNLYSHSTADAAMAPINASGNLTVVGSSEPFYTVSPYQVLNYCIALYGIFPSRN